MPEETTNEATSAGSVKADAEGAPQIAAYLLPDPEYYDESDE